MGKSKKPKVSRTPEKSARPNPHQDPAPNDDQQELLRRDQWPLQLAVDLVLGLPVSAPVETELLAYHLDPDRVGRQSSRPTSLGSKGSSPESEGLFDQARMMLEPEVRAWVPHKRRPSVCLADVTLDDLEPVIIWVKPLPFVHWAIGHGVPVPDDLRRLAVEEARSPELVAPALEAADDQPFCLRLTVEGRQAISRPQYEEEVRRRAGNHLFVDAVVPLTRGMYRVGQVDVQGLYRDRSVASTEADVVVKLAKIGGRVPPSQLADTEHPDKAVEKARRRIDVKVDRRYRCIRTHGHGPTKSYELVPDAGIRWCVLAPLDRPSEPTEGSES